MEHGEWAVSQESALSYIVHIYICIYVDLYRISIYIQFVLVYLHEFIVLALHFSCSLGQEGIMQSVSQWTRIRSRRWAWRGVGGSHSRRPVGI